MVNVRGGGKAGSVPWYSSQCCQLVHLLEESRRDDGVLRRYHRVDHDAQTHRITILHQRQGQTCRQGEQLSSAAAVWTGYEVVLPGT